MLLIVFALNGSAVLNGLVEGIVDNRRPPFYPLTAPLHAKNTKKTLKKTLRKTLIINKKKHFKRHEKDTLQPYCRPEASNSRRQHHEREAAHPRCIRAHNPSPRIGRAGGAGA